MGSNADVEVAPGYHEHHGECDCRGDGPRELSESTRGGAKHGTYDDSVANEARDNGSPKQQLGDQDNHN